MNDFLKEIGRSYLVSSLLPAALFLPIGFIVFYDFIPGLIFERVAELNVFWGQTWFFFLVLIFWVGFWLYSSFQSIIELYMGNWLPGFIKQKMQLRCKEYYSKLLRKYALARKTLKKIDVGDNAIKLNKLRPFAISELGSLGLEYAIPIRVRNVSPTRIGNVFQSSAVYIKDRYNIEGGVMWPRLVHIFPAAFLKNLEEKHNYFSFLLNSSLLAGILGWVGLGTGLVEIVSQWIRKIWNPYRMLQLGDPTNLVIVSIAFIGFSYMFYRLAINAAEDYSQIVCSGFDLYRRDLLSQMGILPEGDYFLDEKQLWGVLSEYMVAGNTLGVKEINFLIKSKVKKKEEEFHPEQTVF